VYITPNWAGARLRSAVRLVLGVALGIVATTPNLLDLSRSQSVPYVIVGTLLLVALIIVVFATLAQGGFTRAAQIEVVPALFLIVLVSTVAAGMWLPIGWWGAWSGDVLVIGFVLYYLVELRGVVKSHPAWYAGLAIGGILVFISLAMADVEAAAANRQITNAGQALLWAAAQVFRSSALVDVKPITPTGEVLGVIVILTSVFFAAVLFSAITAWAVRQGAHRHQEGSRDREIRDHLLAALREAGVLPSERVAESPASRWFIDVDWIAGTRPRAWWITRRDANAEVLALLDGASDGWDGRSIVTVVQGPAHDYSGRHGIDSIPVETTHDICAFVRAEAVPGDVVVTGRPGLTEALAASGIEVEAPGAFLGRLVATPRHPLG
jgi:hypothetical protein